MLSVWLIPEHMKYYEHSGHSLILYKVRCLKAKAGATKHDIMSLFS